MKQFSQFCAIVSLLAIGGASQAQPATQPGESFMRVFTGTCVLHMPDLEELRQSLKSSGAPQLQAPAAKQFLSGVPGDVWPVAEGGAPGNLVLSLPEGGKRCMLAGRKGPQASVEAQFVQLATRAPAPFHASLQTDERTTSPDGFQKHTIAYVWKADGYSRAFAIILSTTSADDAPMQILASETVIGN